MVTFSQEGRNEGRPFQGIDTALPVSHSNSLRLRRNEGRPFQGIDTNFSSNNLGQVISRNEGLPIQGIDTNLRHYSFAQIDKNS